VIILLDHFINAISVSFVDRCSWFSAKLPVILAGKSEVGIVDTCSQTSKETAVHTNNFHSSMKHQSTERYLQPETESLLAAFSTLPQSPYAAIFTSPIQKSLMVGL
jgi:hypothetical protein